MPTLTHPQPRLETARIGAEIKKTGPATVEPAELALATVSQTLPRLNASFSALRGEIGSHGFANLVAQTGDLRLVEVLGHLKDLMILVPHLFKTALGQSERASSGVFKAEAATPEKRLAALQSGLRELSAMEQHLSSPLGAMLVSRQTIQKFFDAASPCIMLDWRALGR